MKFWTSCRMNEKIDFEIFQPVMLEIENRINHFLLEKNYGAEIENYDVVVNIFEKSAEEKFKYNSKKKETDIDVNIDHKEFINADFKGRCILFINSILHSINKIYEDKKLSSIKFDLFYKDVSSLIEKYKSLD